MGWPVRVYRFTTSNLRKEALHPHVALQIAHQGGGGAAAQKGGKQDSALPALLRCAGQLSRCRRSRRSPAPKNNFENRSQAPSRPRDFSAACGLRLGFATAAGRQDPVQPVVRGRCAARMPKPPPEPETIEVRLHVVQYAPAIVAAPQVRGDSPVFAAAFRRPEMPSGCGWSDACSGISMVFRPLCGCRVGGLFQRFTNFLLAPRKQRRHGTATDLRGLADLLHSRSLRCAAASIPALAGPAGRLTRRSSSR